MSDITKLIAQRSILWASENPLEVIGLSYLAKYQTPKLIQAGRIYGSYQAGIMPQRIRAASQISRVILGARGLSAVAAGTTTAIYAGAAAIGAAAGVVVGTAISGAVFGAEGREKALYFYTGQADLIDYVPAYNAYKIVKHYVTE